MLLPEISVTKLVDVGGGTTVFILEIIVVKLYAPQLSLFIFYDRCFPRACDHTDLSQFQVIW